MIASTHFSNRLAAVRRMMAERNLDALMVLVGENRYYLTGFTGEDTQFDETAGILLIAPERIVLATDARYEEQARRESAVDDVVIYKKGISEVLPDLLASLKTRRLGFESVRLSFRDYCKIKDSCGAAARPTELIPVEGIVESLRTVKEEDEILAMRESLALAESAFESLMAWLVPGLTEAQVAWELEKTMRDIGAPSLAFSSIMASGPNSALPHAVPTTRKIAAREPLLFDWGAVLNHYCSDISRMICFSRPDDMLRKVYRTVRDAQQKAVEAARPGMNSRAVDAVAREHIEAMGFKNRFGHGLGHGVGLAVHEAPRISPLQDTILTPGMVFTVEPGVYIPGWGGVRIENMVVVREDGVEVLNRSGTHLNIL